MKKRILACMIACMLCISMACGAMAETFLYEHPYGFTVTVEMGESYNNEDVINVLKLLELRPWLIHCGYFSLPDYLSGKVDVCTKPNCPIHTVCTGGCHLGCPHRPVKPGTDCKPGFRPHRHAFTSKVVEPTCTKGGYTLHSCVYCKYQFKTNEVDRILHWFGAWTPNGFGTHSASCLRDGCDWTSTIDCGKATVVINETEYTFCPVCGDLDDTAMEAVEATAKAVKGENPRGDVVVLAAALENEDILLSVTYEYSGRAENAKKAVIVTLPEEYADYVFTTVDADGVETELDTELTDDGIAFKVDFSETGKVAFIHLTVPAEEATETK